jgi:hypothetical protein
MLYEKKVIPQNIFSLCFAANGGYFSVGGVNTTLHSGVIHYIPFYETNFYRVKLKDITVNFRDFHLNHREFYTIIDSGSTISYFPRNMYSEIEKQINIFCSQIDKCLGDSYPTENGLCFKRKETISFEKFLKSLPEIHFTFENNIKYTWKPKNYLYTTTDSNSNEFCIGLIGWSSNEILLGSTWMHNHDIIFDIQNKRIGFVDSLCSGDTDEFANEFYYFQGKKNFKNISYDNCEVAHKLYLNMIIFVFFISSILICFIAIYVYKFNNSEELRKLAISKNSTRKQGKLI